MKFLDKLDRFVRPIAIANLTEVLIVGQVGMMLASFTRPDLVERSTLVWSRVWEGEVWRLVTFFFFPPPLGLLVIFYFFLFMFMGKALEQHWGTVRYNLYFYLGALLTMLVGLVLPDQPITGMYFQATVFLAFAVLNPNHELLIMLVIPVKVKWLAALQAFSYLMILMSGFNSASLMVMASLGNFLIFFAGDLLGKVKRLRHRAKHTGMQIQENRRSQVARHRCTICQIDSHSHPLEDFRYCSKCEGEHAYCESHLRDHEHIGS